MEESETDRNIGEKIPDETLEQEDIQSRQKKSGRKFYLIAGVVIIIALFSIYYAFSFTVPIQSPLENELSLKGESRLVLSQYATDTGEYSSEEIYKMFLCSCCGSTIDRQCCGMAKDMVKYVDSQISLGLSKSQVVLNTVKKYGITTLVEEEREWVRQEFLRLAPDERPVIEIEPVVFDFGKVKQSEGPVTHSFTVSNTGDSDLIIDSIRTSCGCTTASLEGSDFFGMAGHKGAGASPEGWSYTIPPGGKAELVVKYDPNVHKDFRGDASRTVFIGSNDPVDFSKEVRIELTQVE